MRENHSAEEIKGWGHRPYREETRVFAIRHDFVWVVEKDQNIEGYAHFRVEDKPGVKKASVFGFYLTAAVAGHGIGKKIFAEMLAEMKNQQIRFIELESTLTARNFYHRLGFADTGPETKTEINGSLVRCFPMKMELAYD